MNFRINSKYLPWFEFYNFYFNQLDLKINFYINQIYGGSDIYECTADDVNQKDLLFLTYPISNKKCKNKQSIFNRLFTLDGTKILSGYITPDSYFDIYAEINKENDNVIDISPILKDMIILTNTAKYIKKNKEYTINFDANHMVKLEPGSKAKVTITNGRTTSKLNSQYLAASIIGKDYKITSTEDVMVYFIGRYSSRELVQIPIDIEKSKGKIIKVSNVDDEILLDIGFEGYYPSTYPIDFEERNNGIYYFDNIYEKLNGKLVEGEKVYLYHFAGENRDIKIDYISKSVSHKNNDFNIYYIPGNNEENTLIINTGEIRKIIPDIQFCESDTIVKLSLIGDYEDTITITNSNINSLGKIKLYKGDNKVSFSSNKPFIASFSYYDMVDDDYFDKEEGLKKSRQVLNDLKIESASDKDDKGNTINIKFKPNYKNSLTRYIIIIVQENSNDTLENLNNSCYITSLLSNRSEGVKIDTIYDIGESDIIEAEVNIKDILHDTYKYIVNIISQELRFDKKIKFYASLEFGHVSRAEEGEGKPKTSDDGGSKTTLVLAIVLPIVGVLIIVAIVLFCLWKRKQNVSSSDIENVANKQELTARLE